MGRKPMPMTPLPHRTSLDLIAILVNRALPGIRVDFASVKHTSGDVWTVRLGEVYEGKQYYRIAEGTGETLNYVTPRMLAGTPQHVSGQNKGPGFRYYTQDDLDRLFEERDA